MKGDINALADSVFQAVKGYCDVTLDRLIAKALAPFAQRLDELPVPRDGVDGKDADIAIVKVAVAAEVGEVLPTIIEKAAALVPKPQDGRDGKDGEPGPAGKDADAAAITASVLESVAKVLDEIPTPKDGAPGKDADTALIEPLIAVEVERVLREWPKPRDGIDGESVDMIQLSGHIAAAAEKAVAALPPAPAGKDGEDGQDASPEQIEAAVAKALASIPAPKDGAPGRDGKDADPVLVAELVASEVGKAVAAIPPARDGVDGKNADPEFVRAELQGMVDALPRPADGARGEKGEDGRDGRDAKGEPGRDAIQIDILPAIDETRSYPRSTFASYRGGLIRSIRTTEPVTDGIEKAGWAVVIEGIAGFEIGFDEANPRVFKFAATMTSGKQVQQDVRVPVTIHRGIWKETDTYERGDQVTRDGSQWNLMTEKANGKPGEEGSGWILSAKRGRDGRDGIRGEKGERGAEGRAGRDLVAMTLDGKKY